MILEELKRMVAMMKEHSVKPHIVTNEDEASHLTEIDPCGRKWEVGDEYYSVECAGELSFAVDLN